MIMAQRLVRRLCQACLYSYPAGPELSEVITSQFGGKLLTDEKKIPKVLYRGKGCQTCSFTGYKGRLGIFEVLDITAEIKSIIAAPEFSLEKLQKKAVEQGMISMFEDGLEKVQLAVTSIEEVLRVIRE